MRARTPGDRRGQPARLVAVAVGGVIALVLTHLALGWWWGRWLDTTAYGLVLNGLDGSVRRALSLLAREVAPVLLAGMLLVIAPSLAVRRRSLVPLVLLGAVPVATGTAHLLRTRVVRASSTDVVGPHSFPSTHVAAVTAMLLVLWLLMGAPHRLRGALAAAVALTALGNVAWYAHLPSDAIGGVLVAVVAAALAAAVATTLQRRWLRSAP